MAARVIYNPDAFRNVERDGRIIGYSFQFKAQYYRGITLSIVRGIEVNVDGHDESPDSIRLTVNGETFTTEEMLTVVDPDYRWEFGEYATVTVLRDGGLEKGAHHIKAVQHISPSYMPFPVVAVCETDFVI